MMDADRAALTLGRTWCSVVVHTCTCTSAGGTAALPLPGLQRKM